MRKFWAGLLVSALLAVGGAATTKANPQPAAGAKATTPVLPFQAKVDFPPGFDPSQVKPVTPGNYPNVPINRPEFLPKNPQKVSPDAVWHGTNNCYPSGTAGYQQGCVNPNYVAVGSTYLHYGTNPYTGSGRVVYIVDEIAGTRASEWLVWLINLENQGWYSQNNNRPYFVYFEAGWLRSQGSGYSDYQNCGGSYLQYIEFCSTTASTSSAQWTNNNTTGHIGTGDGRISALNATCCNNNADYYVEYSVLHEFGHLWGLAHTDECASVMTYCSTVGNQYLWYSALDQQVLASIYDGHVS